MLIELLSGAFGAALVAGLFGLLQRRRDQKDKQAAKDDGTTCGVRMLLYAEIKHLGKAYLEHKYITTEELEDLIAMHKVYHDALGGNGFLDALMKQVKSLPIKD